MTKTLLIRLITATLALLPFLTNAQELFVKFRIVNEHSQPIKGSFVRLLNKKELIEEVKTAGDGLCSFRVKLGSEYNIIVNARGFYSRIINVSTVVPPSQILMHEFPQIKIDLDPDIKNSSVEYTNVSEIYFNAQKQAFSYKTSGTKRTKDLNIHIMYFSNAPIEQEPVTEKTKEEPAKPSKETEEKTRSEAEQKSQQKATEQKEAEKLREENEAREKKQQSNVNVDKSAAEQTTKEKEENIKPANEEELLQKKSADTQVDEAIKIGKETKSEREKKNRKDIDRQQEINANRNNKYEKNNSFSNMMNTVSESESSKEKK